VTCLHVQPKVNQIRSFLVQKIANLCWHLLLAGGSYCHDMVATANGASLSSSATQSGSHFFDWVGDERIRHVNIQ